MVDQLFVCPGAPEDDGPHVWGMDVEEGVPPEPERPEGELPGLPCPDHAEGDHGEED
jgi:hypothetical protein